MKGKGIEEASSDHLSSFAHFAGMPRISSNDHHSDTCCVMTNSQCGSWIVDTGASDHMTYNSHFFTSLKPLPTPIHITLTDGSHKTVIQSGFVALGPNLTLHNVLFVPDFKFSLISVSKLLTDLHLTALFTPQHCTFQDPSTKLPVAIAVMDNGLYQLAS